MLWEYAGNTEQVKVTDHHKYECFANENGNKFKEVHDANPETRWN
jgi:hypothetical protein